MIENRILRIGDRLIEMNGKLVTTGLDIGPVQPRHLRLLFAPGRGPSRFDVQDHRSGTWTQLSTYPNIWDLYVYNGSGIDWAFALTLTSADTRMNIVEVIDGDASGIKDMTGCFAYCPNIRFVGPLYNTDSVLSAPVMFSCPDLNGSIVHVTPFDTSSMWNFEGMFYGQSKLKEIPLLDTSNSSDVSYMHPTDVSNMYSECVKVERGILAAYNEMISHGNIPTHSMTFHDCGINTESGRAELAQIPDDWK